MIQINKYVFVKTMHKQNYQVNYQIVKLEAAKGMYTLIIWCAIVKVCFLIRVKLDDIFIE